MAGKISALLESAMIAGTITPTETADRLWDVVIAGAGLAGTVSAIELARCGLSVLLVDKKQFPRDKVCGGCLNAEAVAHLQSMGLQRMLDAVGGLQVNRFSLWVSGKQLSLDLPTGLAVSRYKLDAALVQEAIRAGAEFLPGVSVRVGNIDQGQGVRFLTCQSENRSQQISAKVIVLATGLNSESLTESTGLELQRSQRSRIGIHTALRVAGDEFPENTIAMAVGKAGYMGLARIDQETLNVAAAIDPFVLKCDPISEICNQILSESGISFAPRFDAEQWHGTTAITCSRQQVAAERLFVIGDASGYVEPFTGEGMATAIRGAREVVSFVMEATQEWSPLLIGKWQQTMRLKVRRGEWLCRGLTQLLRMPRLARSAILLTSCLPAVGNAVVRSINHGMNNYEPHLGIGNRRTV